jgi:hypothetical protein
MNLRALTTSWPHRFLPAPERTPPMQTALILSLSATYGSYGVTMVNPAAALAGRPSWNIPIQPSHPR